MKKYILTATLLGVLFFGFWAVSPVLAAEEGAERSVGMSAALELITLLVVGGIIYNLAIGMSGFGGQLGQSLKIVGVGVAVLSLQTLDEILEHVAGVGSETILGEGLLHESAHHIIVLAGFFILALGLSKLTKIVKGLKT